MNFKEHISSTKEYRQTVANLARPIVILGPTTVGKTDVAFGLARGIGAEVINADKFYLYDALPETTGQSDANQFTDVRSHLYGILKPNAIRWTSAHYGEMVQQSWERCRARRRPIVVEGCSFEFVSAAIKALASMAKSPSETPLIVGLRWANRDNISENCIRRAEGMISSGMPAQYRRALDRGEGDTYAMKKCFARDPLLSFVRGEMSRLCLRCRVAAELQRHAERHYGKLSRIRDVTWINHDRGNVEATIQQIHALRSRATGRFSFKGFTRRLLVDFDHAAESDFQPAITFPKPESTIE